MTAIPGLFNIIYLCRISADPVLLIVFVFSSALLFMSTCKYMLAMCVVNA